MSTLVKKTDKPLTAFRRIEDFFDKNLFNQAWFEREFETRLPAVNIKETEKEYIVELAASGLAKQDFKINIEGEVLTISAEKSEEKENAEKGKYTRKEFNYNSFLRSFTLPDDAVADAVKATYTDGILCVNIPKDGNGKTVKPREINIS